MHILFHYLYIWLLRWARRKPRSPNNGLMGPKPSFPVQLRVLKHVLSSIRCFHAYNHWVTGYKKLSGAVNAATDIVLHVVMRILLCIYSQALDVKLEQEIADFVTFMQLFFALIH